MESEAVNRTIFKWLNPDGCWHEFTSPRFTAGLSWCKKCSHETPNPDYTRNASDMLELIEAVRGKGYDWRLISDDWRGVNVPVGKWLAIVQRIERGDDYSETEVGNTIAETLPMAVALATVELIKATEGNNETRV